MFQKQRKEPRVKTRAQTVLVRLQYARDGLAEINRTVPCRMADLSVGGVRVSTDWHMPYEMPIKITIVFKTPAAHFHHIGRVRWVKQSSVPDRFLTGIEFVERDQEALDSWRGFLVERYPELA